jgi:hypothetical protein
VNAGTSNWIGFDIYDPMIPRSLPPEQPQRYCSERHHVSLRCVANWPAAITVSERRFLQFSSTDAIRSLSVA